MKSVEKMYVPEGSPRLCSFRKYLITSWPSATVRSLWFFDTSGGMRSSPAGTPDDAFSGEYGIKLSYTVFAFDPAFKAFPEGTVLAIRNGISALTLFQREKALENRARYEALLKRWLLTE